MCMVAGDSWGLHLFTEEFVRFFAKVAHTLHTKKEENSVWTQMCQIPFDVS